MASEYYRHLELIAEIGKAAYQQTEPILSVQLEKFWRFDSIENHIEIFLINCRGARADKVNKAHSEDYKSGEVIPLIDIGKSRSSKFEEKLFEIFLINCRGARADKVNKAYSEDYKSGKVIPLIDIGSLRSSKFEEKLLETFLIYCWNLQRRLNKIQPVGRYHW